MKKLVFFIFVILASITFTFPSLVSADFNKAYADYSYQISLYRQARDEFMVARSAYQTYKTLTAQTEALAKFKSVLKSRNLIITSYYDLLQERLNTAVAITDEQKNTFNKMKTSQKTWLNDYNVRIDSASSIEDLNSISAEFDSRYSSMLGEGKQLIATIVLAKESIVRGDIDNLYASISGKVNDIRNEGENTILWDRWLLSAKNRLEIQTNKINQANKLAYPESAPNSNNIDLSKIQTALSEANQYLKETLIQLKEILNAITN